MASPSLYTVVTVSSCEVCCLTKKLLSVFVEGTARRANKAPKCQPVNVSNTSVGGAFSLLATRQYFASIHRLVGGTSYVGGAISVLVTR